MSRFRGGVARTLLLSYLLVIVVGVVTLVVAAQAVGPAFFAASMARMMRAHGAGGMMGPGTDTTDTPMTPYLRVAFRDALTAALLAATGARAIASKFAFTLLRDIFIRNDATYAAENPAIGSYRHAAALLRGTKR